MLTSVQIKLVKQSWTSLRDVEPTLLGDVFYSRLFLQHPALRSLFGPSLLTQYNKLVDMLNFSVARIDQPDELTTVLKDLGKRHEQYGVKPEHYAAVGSALLWTLQSALGSNWTVEIASAWASFYQFLADGMQRIQ
ncbi:globin domain-containing protein [Spirosoma sp. KNUC1025]|uniref:globin domain-containing protein n=1 Tax=Spirosoma sp. KNUC1025 TaxID=2894082 RepID=UPI00386E11EB|nr:globin domain-containing protein [Spirosoma sp. KNUC1025]